MQKKYTLGIRYRLFFAFFAATCCVVVSMFMVTKLSFERGVFRYVNQLEKKRLQTLGQSLEQVYKTNATWDFLVSSPDIWMELVAGSRPKHLQEPGRDHKFGHLLDGHGPSLDRPLLLPLPPKERSFESRVVLLSSQKQVLFGVSEPWPQAPYLLPLRLDEQIIGYLGLIPPKILVDPGVKQFASEQQRNQIIIALSIAAVAALLALPLAGKLVRRITSLAAAINQLASGRYAIRVQAEATDEIGQLARDVNSLAQTLENNEQLRRRWVADISHELRTPLAIMRGEIEAVQDGVRTLNPATINGLHEQILHLTHLVNDLYELSLADIGALTYQKRVFDLGGLISQVLQSAQEQFTSHNLALDWRLPDHPAPLFGDRERLHQLLHNLLQNSLHYTDGGGRLEVSLTETANTYTLRLCDSAPGVPEQALPHLFDRLYRVEESRSRAHGGAGLGLALSRSIVEAHGGAISALASSLGGLEIRVTLPKFGVEDGDDTDC